MSRKWLLEDSGTSLTDKLVFQFDEWELLERTEDYVRTGQSIEIHDVKPAGPCVGEAARDGYGHGRERRLPGEVALLQANDAAAAQVDRREDVERTCRGHSAMLSY